MLHVLDVFGGLQAGKKDRGGKFHGIDQEIKQEVTTS
jgi:hypothetical protein